jgi:putative (di)nucleoside polyphosphate hydrolase
VTAGIGLGGDAIGVDAAHLGIAVVVLGLAVLVFGVATLRRVMERNLVTTEFLNGRRLISASHILRDPAALEVFPFVPTTSPLIREKKEWTLGKAGYLEIIALANALLFAVVAAVSAVILGQETWAVVLSGLAGVSIAWLVQVEWAGRVYAHETWKRAEDRQEAVSWWRQAIAVRGERFRAGVGLVVMNSDRKVLMLERVDVPSAWQLPQGGINLEEASEAAAWRELKEEVGLTPAHVELVAASDVWLGYELPPEYVKPKTGRGQTHRWHLFQLLRGTEPPALPAGKGAEFRAHRWVEMSDIEAAAASFRRPEYREVVVWLESVADRKAAR